MFIPTVSVKGFTHKSITVGWNAPPPELREHVQYYNLMVMHGSENKEAMQLAQVFNDYMFMNLDSATTYQFKIAACSEYTKQCGNWSKIINGTTMDGGTSLKFSNSFLSVFLLSTLKKRQYLNIKKKTILFIIIIFFIH